jgi:hypothetical protein
VTTSSDDFHYALVTLPPLICDNQAGVGR